MHNWQRLSSSIAIHSVFYQLICLLSFIWIATTTFTTATALSVPRPAFLHPSFAQEVAQATHPNVALVRPVGVRNMTSQGSAFVVEITPDHVYLLTAAHVAAPGLSLLVSFPYPEKTLTNQPQYQPNDIQATVMGRDIPSDVALIRIPAQNRTFQSLPFATTTTTAVGTLCFASGYPGGIMGGPAMTMGIVCGMAQSSTNNVTFVMTDAGMAGGMSGGPLVTMDGLVIGMNALVRPDLRALGNYAVSAVTCCTMWKPWMTKQSQGSYRVMLYNDPMNQRARVAQILAKAAAMNETEADQVMMAAHTTGSGIVKQFFGDDEGRIQAETLCQLLRNDDVLVEVEQVTTQSSQ